MADEARVIRVDDVLTNLIDPVTKKLVEYHKTLLWHDGTVMNDSKIDSDGVYVKKDDEYFVRSIDDGKQVLRKDNMIAMSNLSNRDRLLLIIGYYTHIELLGYWNIGDGGGGIYILDKNLSGINHDGGSIISLSKHLTDITNFESFIGEDTSITDTGCLVRINNEGILRTEYYGLLPNIGTSPVDNKKAIQACFDYSRENKISNIIVGGVDSVYEIDTSDISLRYRTSNSVLTFEAELRVGDNSGILTGTQLIMFQASNVTIYNMKLDGNRDNNPIREDARGRQFNFTAYESASNLTFIGGYSKNAAQNHMQNTSENLVIDGMTFDISGEHCLYLTLMANNPRKKVTIKNCTFHRWSIDWPAVAISLRDYRLGIVENCVFDPQSDGDYTMVGGGVLQNHVQYDSILGPDETLKHYVRNCYMYGSAGMQYLINGDRVGKNGLYIEGGYMDRTTAGNIVQIKGTKIEISSDYRWGGNPDEIIDCEIYCNGFWFENPILFANNKIYATGRENAGTVIGLQNATGGTFIFKDNDFHNFTSTDSVTFGLIRGNANCVMVVDGNRTYNCAGGRLARSRSVNDIIINNKNMTPSVGAYPVRYDITPKVYGNNSYESVQGTTAERPGFGSSTIGGGVGHRYFDTTIGKVIYWNGTNWVDSNGTTV